MREDALQLLPVDETFAALEEAIAARELTLIESRTKDRWRLSGLPEAGRDLWLVTDARSVANGFVAFECFLPVVVPPGRLEAVLEACLWLSSQGRVRFSVERCRPVASADVTVPGAAADHASALIGATLDVLSERAAAYEAAFHGVAAGARVEVALAALEDESMAEILRKKPWAAA